jgi:hypothetical protein
MGAAFRAATVITHPTCESRFQKIYHPDKLAQVPFERALILSEFRLIHPGLSP